MAFDPEQAFLPLVKAPTLVLHCRGDAVQPFDEGQQLAAAFLGARFVGLEGAQSRTAEGRARLGPPAETKHGIFLRS